MANKEARLRKYKRKKSNARSLLFDKYARLYWRYHFQVYGDHKLLWSMDL